MKNTNGWKSKRIETAQTIFRKPTVTHCCKVPSEPGWRHAKTIRVSLFPSITRRLPQVLSALRLARLDIHENVVVGFTFDRLPFLMIFDS